MDDNSRKNKKNDISDAERHNKESIALLKQIIQKSRTELAGKTRFIERLFRVLPTFVYLFDISHTRFLFVNQSIAPFLGYTKKAILGMDGEALSSLLHPEDSERICAHYASYSSNSTDEVFEIEFRVRHDQGDWHWISIREIIYERSAGGKVLQVLGISEDITEQQQTREKLWYATIHDPLTGLYNRTFYEEEISRLERGRHYPVTILIADIDGLHEINDHYGYSSGDALIRETAMILKACFRAEDLVARIGGDEFAVLVPDIGSISVDAIQARVQRRVESYNETHKNNILNISVGFASAERRELLRDSIREAERRMVSVKRAKRKKEKGT